jgi:predicted helicase
MKKVNELAKVFHFDLYGKREYKYDFLSKNSFKTIPYKEILAKAPMYFMIHRDINNQTDEGTGFILSDIFIKSGMGIATGDDKEFVSFSKKELETKFENLSFIKKIDYRLFDTRYIYYDNNKIERGRKDLMRHMLGDNNLGLISLKRVRKHFTSKFGIVNHIVDKSVISTLDNGYVFPLYLYPENSKQQNIDSSIERTPNLNQEIVEQIARNLKLTFTNEKENTKDTFSPIDILDYIYAVLHSPTYRKKYEEDLKIDFPRIQYPKDLKSFRQLIALGSQLRQIQLLEDLKVNKPITKYPVTGDNIINDLKYNNNKVFINDTQYFKGVPEIVWDFYIGGYQPAQKWLKDRKGRTLSFEDIMHYQKIIVALSETDRLMQEIDKIEIE